jgi:hypothetical protein
LLATALYALRAAPGDWAVRTAIGPLGMSLSVPALLRVASHPLGIRPARRPRLATPHGTLHFRVGCDARATADRALRALRARTRASSPAKAVRIAESRGRPSSPAASTSSAAPLRSTVSAPAGAASSARRAPISS